MFLRVIPTRPDLPRLEYSRFRTLHRGTWPKAVDVVCGYIDQALDELPSQFHGGYSELGSTKRHRHLSDKL
jgi:hypothetical protein